MWQRAWKRSVTQIVRRRVLFFPLFFILRVGELIYSCVFSGAQFLHRAFGGYNISPRVISVGNIAAGGVGKSLLVEWIARELKNKGKRVTILLRGYKGANEQTRASYSVQHSGYTTADVAYAGDEAYMLRGTGVDVVVGSSRLRSWSVAAHMSALYSEHIDYVVLDDAYQNRALRKDVDIVLLDARNPFDTGHCFPLGELREKDLSRADGVILTHAAVLTCDQKQKITNQVRQFFPRGPIMYAYHQPVGVFDEHGLIDVSCYGQNRFIACAGIGSFAGFESVLKRLSVSIAHNIPFSDHHTYTKQDVARIEQACATHGISRIITTDKDWEKLTRALCKWGHLSLSLYRARIQFAFLSRTDHELFMRLVE